MNDNTKAKAAHELVFPTDVGGNLLEVKRSTLKAISRMYGNVDKYKALKDTLLLLTEFAETRMRMQMVERKQAVAASLIGRAVDGATDQDTPEDAPQAPENGAGA